MLHKNYSNNYISSNLFPNIIVSTLREGYDGEVSETNIEIAILKNTGFQLLTPEQVKNYLKD